MGPGIITANVDNDAGGIATYSIAGAHFGYAFVWTIVPIIIALVVVQEMSARMGVVTGKGLADLIRENFGVKVTFYVMLALLLTNLANTVAEFAGVAAALGIFNISKYLSIPLAAIFVWVLIIKGSYRSVERVFLIACVFYVAYLISGFMARPVWGDVWHAAIHPTFRFETPFFYMVIGLVGTTIAPWMQFYMQSSVVEKGLSIEKYSAARWDVWVGCVMAGVVVLFIIVACAATLFPAGVHIDSAADAALALKPLAGKYCSFLFAFGLFNASLFAASVLPLATAYYVCEGLGFEEGIDRSFAEAPQFYGLYTAIIVMGALIVLIPGFPLLDFMVFSQVLNGLLLPLILILMLILANRKDVMGAYTLGRGTNIVTWMTVVGLIVCALFMAAASLS